VSGNKVYAGGIFNTAGGNPVQNIAMWDGSSWSGLGSGMNSWVFALAAVGNDLYAGGYFSTAGGVPTTSRLARWDGAAWSAVGAGSGINSDVQSLVVSGDVMYVGGAIYTGSEVFGCVAKATLPSTPPPIILLNCGFANGVFGFDVSGSSGQTVVTEGSTNLLNWVPLQTNVLGGASAHFSDSRASRFVQRLYRARMAQ
jgi:hypothetical protein